MGKRLQRVKRYLELGRTFSAMLTAGAAILGAYSVGVAVQWWQILVFLAIGFFSHAFGCALNEICDYELDKKVPEIAHKPLVKGDITMVSTFRSHSSASLPATPSSSGSSHLRQP